MTKKNASRRAVSIEALRRACFICSLTYSKKLKVFKIKRKNPKKIPRYEMDLSSKGRNSCNSELFFLEIW